MDLNFSPAENAFRAGVQDFLKTELSPALADRVRRGVRLSRADMAGWHDTLNRRGWLAPHWPEEWGGTGWSTVERFIFDHECALAFAPRIVPFGVAMLGPVLLRYGTEAQKKHWLPRILDGSDWWCQGYSEPGAGSDLASLQTTAVRTGEHYVVNGQKTWTTLGQHANMIFCLVRTDRAGRKQEGISFLLIDLATPGIEMRPITLLDGEREVNEVFFTDVRVPLANLVGEEGRGWSCAKYLLTHERTNIAGVGFSVAALGQLRQVAARIQRGGRPLDQDPLFAARMARVSIELDNMTTTNLRVLAATAAGGAPGAESSMLKIKGTEIRQEISALMRLALGPHAIPFPTDCLEPDFSGPAGELDGATAAAANYFNLRKVSIFGGSNEIQRNIISRAILGL